MTSGGEEVCDFMRLDMGQGAADPRVSVRSTRSVSHSMSPIFPKIAQWAQNASTVPKIPQNEPKMSKMQVNCE